jgi:hypothetical protein
MHNIDTRSKKRGLYIHFITSVYLRAGIAQPVQRLATRSTTEGSYRVKSFLHVDQTGSVAQPASYTMGTGGSFLESKAAGA